MKLGGKGLHGVLKKKCWCLVKLVKKADSFNRRDHRVTRKVREEVGFRVESEISFSKLIAFNDSTKYMRLFIYSLQTTPRPLRKS